MLAMLADYQAGGPVADLLAGWPRTVHSDVVGLRLAGALHYAVLSGRDEALAAAYPGANPDWSMDHVWPIARDYLARDEAFVREFIKSAPQTNEVNRSLILLPGFLELAARFEVPMHLLELGASAGLNQNWDRYNYRTNAWAWRKAGGDASKVTLEADWCGPVPDFLDAVPDVVSRAACDLNPVDVDDEAQALRLQSYVWPDQPNRMKRLAAAIALAQETGVNLQPGDAADWAEAKLARRAKTGLTVLFHSVFLQYPPADVQARILAAIEQAGREATPDAPFAWLCYEAEAYFGDDKTSRLMQAQLKVWPGGEAKTYARSDGHVMVVAGF